MSVKHRSKGRVNPRLTNHSGFKNLRNNWLKNNPLHQRAFFRTKHFTPETFLKPLELASLDNTSIDDACNYYRFQGIVCPSSELLLKRLREEPDDRMEIHVNQTLRQQFESLPLQVRRWFKRCGVVIIDFHDDPYYGQANPNILTRNVVKQSTNRFYCYLTAELYTPRGRQTIALRFRKPGESIWDLFWDLFASIEAILTPKMILMDGEFATVQVLKGLVERNISFVARKSITQRLSTLALAYKLTDGWVKLRQFHAVTLLDKMKKHEVTVHVTFQQVKGQMKALVLSPNLSFTPDQADRWYARRFGIETGYRDKHLFQGRTSSTNLTVRLMLFLFAIMLYNLWQAFLILVFPRGKYPLSRLARWRRRARTIKRFLMRDELL